MPPDAVALVGAEFEENLSLRYLAASVARDGFRSTLFPFNEAREAGRTAYSGMLPEEPGFYQAELVADYGADGLSLDTMAFEVT